MSFPLTPDSLLSPTIDNAQEYPILEVSKYVTEPAAEPSAQLKALIQGLGLIKHREGGYFKETDRSPFTMEVGKDSMSTSPNTEEESVVTRNYSTLIYYLLTPDAPIGKLHKNKNRITHILQRGRGQYVLIYPNGQVKSFRVGFDYKNGELSQWVVPGGVYKASFIVPNTEFDDGLLISEVVVPGFDFEDHTFMSGYEELADLVGETRAKELKFLL